MWRVCAMLFVATVAGCAAMRDDARPAPTEVHAPLRVAAPLPVPPVVSQPPVEVLRASAKQVAPDDPLALVAKCLENADNRGAAQHLETYVRVHPGQLLFRLQLAELYVKCDQPAEAKLHYERFVTDATGAALRPHVIAAHIKLMEMAQRADDRFGELYHRGAGLLLLVKDQDGAKARDAEFCEEMSCKALRALTEAKELKPHDTRTHLLLADALDRVGSRHAAAAERAATKGGLASEGRKLLE